MSRTPKRPPSGAGPGESALALAICRENWEMAALCLLLGVSRAARALPEDTVEALLEILSSYNRRPAGRSVRRGQVS